MAAAAGILVQLLFLLHTYRPAAGASQTPIVAYRFHHLHVSVADPAGAMNAAAVHLGGTRTLLQGHGVAVRSAGQYLVFDREDNSPDSSRGNAAPTAYGEAVRWLADRNGTAEPRTFTETALSIGAATNPISAIAFSSEDLSEAIAALAARGEQPFERTTQTVRFRLPSGVPLEIVRETDLPDAYWCPMHPDVRTPRPDKCPLCGMALVSIPPPRLGEYRLDATLTAGAANGSASLRLAVRDPTNDDLVERFVEVHERFLHLFAVSRDLSTFAHLHPEQRKHGGFELRWDLPPGEYMLIGDFLPSTGTPQMVHRAIVTPGYSGPLFAPGPALEARAAEQVVDGVRIRLDAQRLVAFRPADLRFTFSDARTGTPIDDLEPFLGASGHLLLVNPDITTAIHGHPEGALSSGPMVTFAPLIPAPGAYKLWVQVQRAGKVITAPFVITVQPPSP